MVIRTSESRHGDAPVVTPRAEKAKELPEDCLLYDVQTITSKHTMKLESKQSRGHAEHDVERYQVERLLCRRE